MTPTFVHALVDPRPGSFLDFNLSVTRPAFNNQPLDLVICIDLSGSFANDLPIMRSLVPDIMSSLLETEVSPRFGITTFIDQPDKSIAETVYPYRLNLPLTDDSARVSCIAALPDVGAPLPCCFPGSSNT